MLGGVTFLTLVLKQSVQRAVQLRMVHQEQFKRAQCEASAHGA